jgi:hypothetical protein
VAHGRRSEEFRAHEAVCGTVIDSLARDQLECGVVDVVSLIVAPSVRAARLFALGLIDFAFLDADHDYQSVRSNLAA